MCLLFLSGVTCDISMLQNEQKKIAHFLKDIFTHFHFHVIYEKQLHTVLMRAISHAPFLFLYLTSRMIRLIINIFVFSLFVRPKNVCLLHPADGAVVCVFALSIAKDYMPRFFLIINYNGTFWRWLRNAHIDGLLITWHTDRKSFPDWKCFPRKFLLNNED